ncbi:hypothetical protein [uncultured Dokdonia sp.]|uniref:hypothetical protein n=1 Tax=uncultured Dokdonia sp. TaxID=575653 RepID=UPI0026304C52|nr:hypothetical protein [uncultured Dokdonia sp.]
MKKVLSYFLLALIVIACSTEENIDSSTDIATLEVENYKGIFTTVNGDNRGTLDVTLSDDALSATANLTLATGEVISITTDQISNLGNTKEIIFTSNELSFTMTTGNEGETLEINTVSFRGAESSILAARNTSRAPVTPVTGTYTCTTCAGPVDNSMTQTFNFMFVTADGDSSIATQTTLGMTVYNGIGVQDNCIASGDETTCDVTSGDGMTTVGYTAGDGDVTWSGTHTFNNEATGPNDCSGISGTWSWASPLVGTVDGTFVSDVSCTEPLTTLYSEDFQSFTGAGFAPMPSAGQLDSDIVIVDGVSGSLDYGGTQTSGDFARGTSNGGVGTGGIYAFDVDGAGDTSLGAQPTGGDFTPGSFDFRIENTTGAPVSNFMISYDIYVNNNGAVNRSNSLNFSYSTDNITFTPIPALDYASPGTSDALGFVSTMRSASFSATVADGAFIYIRFESNDISGSDSRDELAIDNILLQAN